MYKQYKGEGWSTYKISEKLGLPDDGVTSSNWVKNEPKILEMRTGQRCAWKGRPAAIPDVEDRLFTKFREMRAKGFPIKRTWFVITAKSIYRELYQNIKRMIPNISNSPGGGLEDSNIENKYLSEHSSNDT
ncbi:hypothetical protein ABW20_dc0106306 [Dactylellina cionopaga]|nr:hypothetical protein ABW20_dc0106306 [Dactylellina cionopaga]